MYQNKTHSKYSGHMGYGSKKMSNYKKKGYSKSKSKSEGKNY